MFVLFVEFYVYHGVVFKLPDGPINRPIVWIGLCQEGHPAVKMLATNKIKKSQIYFWRSVIRLEKCHKNGEVS